MTTSPQGRSEDIPADLPVLVALSSVLAGRVFAAMTSLKPVRGVAAGALVGVLAAGGLEWQRRRGREH